MALSALMCSTASFATAQTIEEIRAPLTAPENVATYFADIQAAAAAMDAERYDVAEPILTRLTSAYPLDADTWIDLGIARRVLNQPAGAIDAYQHAIALAGPNFRRAQYRLAQLYTQVGDMETALDAVARLVGEAGYIARPGLMSDPVFESLRASPRFQALAGEPQAPATDRVAGWRGDLDFLVAEIHRLSPRHRDRDLPPETLRVYAELREQAPTLSDEQMYAGMSRLVGTLNQNHTMLWGGSSEGGPDHPVLHFIPLQLYIFPEGVFVVGAGEGHADLVGAELIAIEDTSAAEALTRVRGAMSVGGAAEALWLAPARLTDASLLRGLGLTAETRRVSLRLRLANGRVVTRRLNSAPAPILAKLPAPPQAPAPLFLEHVADQHWLQTWPDASTVYAQVNQIAPSATESLEAMACAYAKCWARAARAI